MPLTRKMEEQLKSILAAIGDVKESTNNAIAASNESTNNAIAATNIAIAASNESMNSAIAASNESMNAAIADVKESTNAAVAEIKEITATEIEKVFAKVEAEREATNGAIRNMEERIKQLEMKGVPKEEGATNIFGSLGGLECISAVPATTPGPRVKISIYDGKSAWDVYKTQFDIVAAANGWSDVAKAYNLAASLRGEAADILLTIPEDRRTDLATLTTALELRFGNQHLKDYTRAQLKSRRQRPGESLQEMASEIERLSLIAFPDCPADVRDTLTLEYFVDAIRDPDTQTRIRLSDAKDLKSALIFSMKVEAAHLASGKDRRSVCAVAVQDTVEDLERRFRELERLLKSQYPDRRKSRESKINCWTCKKEGHFRRDCPERDGTPTEEPPLN